MLRKWSATEVNQIIFQHRSSRLAACNPIGGDGYEIVESGLERVPTTTKALDAAQTEELESLIEKLEGDDDVQAVFHTMAPSIG